MFRRFQAWEANGNRVSLPPIVVFGSIDQALADARAEIETTKEALLTTKQDLGYEDHEISIWK